MTKKRTCLLETSTLHGVSGVSLRGTDCSGKKAEGLQVKLSLLPNLCGHSSIREPTTTTRGTQCDGMAKPLMSTAPT